MNRIKRIIFVTKPIVFFTVIAGICGLFIYLWTGTKLRDTMYIKSLQWERVVYEKDDYYTTECGMNSNGDLRCKQVRKTRIINRCPSSGAYPQEPYFTDCPIAAGHYRTDSEHYYAQLIHNGQDEYTFKTWYEQQYKMLEPEQVWCVKINHFGVATALNHKKECKE